MDPATPSIAGRRSVLVVNANTSAAMTMKIEASSRAVPLPEAVTLEVIGAASGPESIETALDEALAVPGMVEACLAHPRPFHAIISACGGDPGLAALTEAFRVPAIGVMASAMREATRRFGGFGLLALRADRITTLQRFAELRGYASALCGVSAAGLEVLEIERHPDLAQQRVAATLQQLRDQGCPAVIVACVGLGPWTDALSEAFGIPCIDPVRAGVRAALDALRETPAPSSVEATSLKRLKGYAALQRLYRAPQATR